MPVVTRRPGAAQTSLPTAGSRAGGAPAAPALPQALRGPGNRLPTAAMAAVLVSGLALPGSLARFGPAVAAVGLLAGLPHGAVDHLVPAWVLRRRLGTTAMGLLLVGYVAAAGAMFLLLRLGPRVALAVFLALSLLHFGAGEVAYDEFRRGPGSQTHGARRRQPLRALDVLAWGGAVVLLPLCRWPDQVRPVLDLLAPNSGKLLTPGLCTGTVLVVLAAVAGSATAAVLERRFRAAAELALVTLTMTVVPPLAAFAVYFGCWHSVRHVVRLLATDPANEADLRRGRRAGPLLRFLRSAALPTAVSLLALGALWVVTGPHALLLTSNLQLLAALTVPHMAVVAWLDRRADRGALSAGAVPAR